MYAACSKLSNLRLEASNIQNYPLLAADCKAVGGTVSHCKVVWPISWYKFIFSLCNAVYTCYPAFHVPQYSNCTDSNTDTSLSVMLT